MKLVPSFTPISIRRSHLVVRSRSKDDRPRQLGQAVSKMPAATDRTILIATEGPDVSGIASLIKSAGYETISTSAERILEARDAGLILLVSRDSSSAVRLLRSTIANVNMPVIVICEESASVSASQCILRGADDYLVAPFDEGELLARVHGALRRYRIGQAGRTVQQMQMADNADPFVELRLDDWSIALDSRPIRLTEVQYGIVARLVASTGEWVRTGALQKEVLKANAARGASNVRFHVLQIRRALGRRAGCLHSRQRRGYMWSPRACDTPHCICHRLMPEPSCGNSACPERISLA